MLTMLTCPRRNSNSSSAQQSILPQGVLASVCACVRVCVCGILKERAHTRVKFERLSRCRQSGNRAGGHSARTPLGYARLGLAGVRLGCCCCCCFRCRQRLCCFCCCCEAAPVGRLSCLARQLVMNSERVRTCRTEHAAATNQPSIQANITISHRQQQQQQQPQPKTTTSKQ